MDNLSVILKPHFILQHSALGLAFWDGTWYHLGATSLKMPFCTVPHPPLSREAPLAEDALIPPFRGRHLGDR